MPPLFVALGLTVAVVRARRRIDTYESAIPATD
jgi:hypothetical protein